MYEEEKTAEIGLLRTLIVFFLFSRLFNSSMHTIGNENCIIQSSTVGEMNNEENERECSRFSFLEVRMLVRDFYMSMKRINFMQVHMNGDRFISIWSIMNDRSSNRMNL